MAQDPWQLSGSGPESYEKFQVPSMFGPLAEVFLQHVELREGDDLLDVACGTGIVSRYAAPKVGPTGSITGLDLNAGMLDVAARNAPSAITNCHWQGGDAQHLPFDDATFDVVVCQQGLQFVPDKLAAAREMHRVLKPGGRVGVCVWRSIEFSPTLSAVSVALSPHLDDATVAKVRAPFSFGDEEQVRTTLADAGFGEVSLKTATLTRTMLSAEQSIPGLIASTPAGPAFAELDEDIKTDVIDEVAVALRAYRTETGFSVPQETYVAQARRFG